jgi:hypothetical protein
MKIQPGFERMALAIEFSEDSDEPDLTIQSSRWPICAIFRGAQLYFDPAIIIVIVPLGDSTIFPGEVRDGLGKG